MESQIFGQRCFRDLLPLTVEASCQMYPPRVAARVAWEWTWFTEVNKWSKLTGILPQCKLCMNLPISRMYISLILRFKFYTVVRHSTCKSYRSLLLKLCYVKHSVGSKLFFQLEVIALKVFVQQSSEATNNKYYSPQLTERLIQHCMPIALLWSSVMLGMFKRQGFPWKEALLFVGKLWQFYDVCYTLSRRRLRALRHKWSICGIFEILCEEAPSALSGKTERHFF